MKRKYLVGLFLMLVSVGLFYYAHWSKSKGVEINNKVTVATTTPPPEPDMVSEALAAKIVPQVRVSTLGWKTCKNTEYGYEFKYPVDWDIWAGYSGPVYSDTMESKLISTTSCEGSDYTSVSSKKTRELSVPPPPEGYTGATTTTCTPNVTVVATPKNKIYVWNSDKQLINDQYIIDVANHYRNKVLKVFEIDHKNAFLADSGVLVDCQPLRKITIATEKALLTLEGKDILEPEFETILSTFKFTEKNPQP